MIPFQLYSDLILNANNVTQSSSQIVVTHTDGIVKSYGYPSASIASYILIGIQALQANPTGLYLFSVLPVPFDFTTMTVTITGANFSPTATYLLHIEDPAGGKDNNGIAMACTYVNANTMTAFFSTFGDSGSADTMWLYLYDGTNYSNIIIATHPAGGYVITY